jgi:hypothetical protein
MLPLRWLLFSSVFFWAACSRTAGYDHYVDGHAGPEPQPETCNGLDDDIDIGVDEDFRDEVGRYVTDEHCGRCDAPCAPMNASELATMCTIIDETPVCAAIECAPGFAVSTAGRCIPAYEFLCLPCLEARDCGDLPQAQCARIGTESRCTVGCALGCPEGYVCGAEDTCVPSGGSCSCDPGESFTLACALLDPMGNRCVGSAVCDDGTLSECVAPEDVCDHVDNDCDGRIDQAYRDRRGAYILDVHHCGECGVDCTADMIPEGDLVCGGDPFAPSCVLDCPDSHDGIQPGDRLDADRIISNGCECTVSSPDDVPGPVRTEGEDLDVNCDGADGIVVESFYVAPDGDDTGPGSPTRPLQTIAVALMRALESLESEDPRPHVFIASGSYTESIEVPDGVRVHGGYRRDFLALDPDGFRVEVRAPSDTMAPGGAALVIREAGASETVVEWVSIQGRDAIDPGAATFGAYVLDPGPLLALREMQVRSGIAGAGMNGAHGAVGSAPAAEAAVGGLPRAAIEDAGHTCTAGMSNLVPGGRGGTNTCDGERVDGGAGGSPSCPTFAEFQPSGARGRGTGGGAGGEGGQDSQGPITGVSCPEDVCCGLADFTVPTDFRGPQSGNPGRDGTDGSPGRGCRDALGDFSGDTWSGEMPTAGSAGDAGAGGGGGGGGGGAEMTWSPPRCEWPDGLGGGGGGGGAGGCGGERGEPGTSGGPSVAILVRYSARAALPSIRGVQIAPRDGGRGGDGGAGGDGGLGGTGAFGGALAREDRSTPPLAGPFPGGRGGRGGNGGAGGGGGGGCGGGSVGIWVTGLGSTEPPGTAALRTGNMFMLGRGGQPGRGGGGAAPAADGAEGGAIDVVVR